MSDYWNWSFEINISPPSYRAVGSKLMWVIFWGLWNGNTTLTPKFSSVLLQRKQTSTPHTQKRNYSLSSPGLCGYSLLYYSKTSLWWAFLGVQFVGPFDLLGVSGRNRPKFKFNFSVSPKDFALCRTYFFMLYFNPITHLHVSVCPPFMPWNTARASCHFDGGRDFSPSKVCVTLHRVTEYAYVSMWSEVCLL